MDSMYSDEDGPSNAQMPGKDGGEDMDDQQKGETEGGKTALVDSDICPGMKPGDMIQLRIERVMDKQYQVSYEPSEDKEKMPDKGGAPAPERDRDMADMME